MSAGGLSYSGLVNHGKVSLPSVSGWGTNLNILRDPPKSIKTRKIDKVGDTNLIIDDIEAGSDRICEAINVYARGVNPSVSVSYSNNGSNGGRRSGGITNMRSAKPPIQIMKDGAFRPPIRLQQDLLPLSRQNRLKTEIAPTPGFADFTKVVKKCGDASNTKEVKNNLLNVNSVPTKTYKLTPGVKENFEIKYVIQPSITNNVKTGVRGTDITQLVVKEPTKELNRYNIHADLITNKTDINNYVSNNGEISKDNYIQDQLVSDVTLNKTDINNYVSNNGDISKDNYIQDQLVSDVTLNKTDLRHNTTSLNDIAGVTNIPVFENIIHTDASSGLKYGEKVKYLHEDLTLDKNLPIYSSTTNHGDSRVSKIKHDYLNSVELSKNNPNYSFTTNSAKQGNYVNVDRKANLRPRLEYGGFHNNSSKPMPAENVENLFYSNHIDSNNLSKKTLRNYEGRFN